MEKILVLDFGGQYNQLIARRVRDHHVYAEILPYTTPLEEIKANNYKGIIFTGGPNSVFDMESPHYTKDILEIGVPILGICYGCQLIAWMADGEVKTAPVSEYGKIELNVLNEDAKLYKDIPKSSTVWMSHTDYIATAPQGFEVIANTNDCPCASMQNVEKGIYAVQFHPEVTHSEFGNQLLYNFLYKIREAGITVPVIPGIMPITRANQLERALKLSGSFMPYKFKSLVDKFGSDSDAMKQAGIAYAISQIIDLYANGVQFVHVYTMNKPDVALAIQSGVSDILGKKI